MMIRLIYLSTAVRDMSDDDLNDILEKSRKNNGSKDITGLLIIKGRTFLQCLEGEEIAVQELFEKIEKDERHKNILEFEEEQITERYFPNWEMGFKNIANLTAIESEQLKDFTFNYSSENLPHVFKRFIDIN